MRPRNVGELFYFFKFSIISINTREKMRGVHCLRNIPYVSKCNRSKLTFEVFKCFAFHSPYTSCEKCILRSIEFHENLAPSSSRSVSILLETQLISFFLSRFPLPSHSSYKNRETNKLRTIKTTWSYHGACKSTIAVGFSQRSFAYSSIGPVSYTHLTLPTIYSV